MESDDKTKKLTGDAVGYGKPPVNTRFKKGQSGNPKGRRKATLNPATVLARALRERVVINENGRRKTVTKWEAATKQVANKAASGDLGAVKLVSMLLQNFEGQSGNRATPALDGEDQKVAMRMLERLKSAEGGQDK